MRALTFWTVPPVLICKLNSKVISGKMFLLQLSVFPCYSVHSSFYINMLFYIIFTIFKGKFCNNQERYVKPKLDAKIATSILKSLYQEILFLLQIMHSFPFYHHWTSLKDQAENDANCFNFIFSEWLCSLRNSAWGSRLVLSQHQVSLLHPCFSAFHSPLEGGVPKRQYSHILPFLISVSQAPESYLKIMEVKKVSQ